MKSIALKSVAGILVIALFVQWIRSTSSITFESLNFYPGGITYDSKRNLFYLSSIPLGKVAAVDRKGNFRVICSDTSLISTTGLKYNSINDKLYVLNGKFGAFSKASKQNIRQVAQLFIINTSTFKIEHVIDLLPIVEGPKHFPSDLAIDAKGNVYITDSHASAIYKVDTTNKATLFSKSELLKPTPPLLGINGIACHQDGYLLVAKTGEGSLLKISLTDSSKIEKVKLPEPLASIDGIYFISPNKLVAVKNNLNKTVFLKSKDGWKSAEIVKEENSTEPMPTKVAAYKEEVFVINSKLIDMMLKKENKTFVIDIFSTK